MRCVICFVVITVFTATFQPLVAVAFICSIINTLIIISVGVIVEIASLSQTVQKLLQLPF